MSNEAKENEAAAKPHSETGWAYAVIYDDLKNCGCGYADDRIALVREALRDCPLYEDEGWRKYDSALGEWFLCLLDGAELIEHGSSIGGSWLTPKGQRFLDVLNDETAWTDLLGDDIGYCECADCSPSRSSPVADLAESRPTRQEGARDDAR